MSSILDNLDCSWAIENTPRDGDCFYHAFIRAFSLDVSPRTLRSFIAARITDEDALVFVGINGRYLQRAQVQSVIRDTKAWADEVEISTLIRNIPSCAVVIVDENQRCLVRRGRLFASHKAVLYLKDEHYQIVWGATKHLFTMMGGEEYVVLDGKHSDLDMPGVAVTFCFIVVISLLGAALIRLN